MDQEPWRPLGFVGSSGISLDSWSASGALELRRYPELAMCTQVGHAPFRGHWMSPNQKLIDVLVVSIETATFGGSTKENGRHFVF